MTFNEHINTGFHTYTLDERQDKVNNMLLEFTDNMIDTGNIDYTINDYNLLTGWDITYNNTYTDKIFNTDKIVLTRQIKLNKLIK